MRTDPAKRSATQEEGKKDEARDLDSRNQPASMANRDRRDRADDDTGEAKVRAQDPGFGRGRH